MTDIGNTTDVYSPVGKFIHIGEKYIAARVLSMNEMGLLSAIEGFELDKGSCFASNDYLGAHIHATPNTINNVLNRLQKMGLIWRAGKGRNRRIGINYVNLEKFLNDNNSYLNSAETENTTKIVEMKNVDDTSTTENTTKNVEQHQKNCETTPQNLCSITIEDNNTVYDSCLSSQDEILGYNISNIDTVTPEEPTTENNTNIVTGENTTSIVMEHEPAPDLKTALYYAMVEQGANLVTLKDYKAALDAGYSVSQIIFAALGTKNTNDNFVARHHFTQTLKYKPDTSGVSDDLANAIMMEMKT